MSTPANNNIDGNNNNNNNLRTPSSAISDAQKMASDFSASMSSMFNTLSSAATSSVKFSGNNSAAKVIVGPDGKALDEISKDEIMQLCMKMNKRMKGLEQKIGGISKAGRRLLNERKELIEYIKDITPSKLIEALPDPKGALSLQLLPEDDEVLSLDFNSLKMLCMNEQSKMKLNIDQLQREITNLKFKASNTSNNNIANNNDESNSDEIPSSTSLLSSLHPLLPSTSISLNNDSDEIQIAIKLQIEKYRTTAFEASQQVESIKALKETTEAALKERVLKVEEKLKIQTKRAEYLEEKIKALQIELKSSKDLANEINEKELDSVCNICKNLQEVNDRTSKELNITRDKLIKVERLAASATSIETTNKMLNNELRQSKVKIDSLIKENDTNINERIKNEGSVERVTFLEQRLTTLQESVQEKDSIITRIRGEAQTAQRNHALKVALLATAEAEIKGLNNQLDHKNKSMSDLENSMTKMKQKVDNFEKDTNKKNQRYEKEIKDLKAHIENEQINGQRLIESTKKQHSEIILEMQKEYQKKLNISRSMLSQKEEEVKNLTMRVAAVEEEIVSGGPNERRIFQLAAEQAKRDAKIYEYQDTRELAFVQLQEALTARDLEVAKLMHRRAELEKELSQSRCTTKRNGVNMTYLKYIILQFMTLPLSAPERLSLVPVIGTLLQFQQDELKKAQNASQNPHWTTRTIKEMINSNKK